MKKNVICFLSLITSVVLLPISFASADEQPDTRDVAAFAMPFSLEKIEDEAFEGTAVKVVVFQDGLVSIGDYAFANARSLKDVYIPSSTEYIGENAFPSSKRLTIHGVMRSYAAKWAKEHEIPFMPSNFWNKLNDSEGTDETGKVPTERIQSTAANSEKINSLHGRTEDEGKSMRPQERPELNPIDYRFP